MKTEEIALSRVVENDENPRTITTEKFQKLVKSLLVFPRMLTLRPIVVDETMTVLGGNMRLRALKHIVSMDWDTLRFTISDGEKFTQGEVDALLKYWEGWRKKPVATIVNATDLTEAQKKEFIIKDNVGFGDWDTNMLANEWNALPLDDWGLDFVGLNMEMKTEEGEGDDDSDNNYERKIVAPIYEPQDGDVSLSDCYCTSKVDLLVSAIDEAEINEDIKCFLKVAAYRHAKFNYEKVADYYAKAPMEVQKLMEDSALVIVDMDKAIEDGFVKLSKDFLKQYGKEYGNDAE